jgi:hypothetical protein
MSGLFLSQMVIIFPEALMFLLGDGYRRELGSDVILKVFL